MRVADRQVDCDQAADDGRCRNGNDQPDPGIAAPGICCHLVSLRRAAETAFFYNRDVAAINALQCKADRVAAAGACVRHGYRYRYRHDRFPGNAELGIGPQLDAVESADAKYVIMIFIVLVDDSIVRGTTSKQLVKLIREANPKSIHLRIFC